MGARSTTRPLERSPEEADPQASILYWVARLEGALSRQAWKDVADAQAQLRRLGVVLRFVSPEGGRHG